MSKEMLEPSLGPQLAIISVIDEYADFFLNLLIIG